MTGLIRVDCYYYVTEDGEERIATAQYLSPTEVKITYWDPRGPLDHLDVPPERAEALLLRKGYEPANWAGDLLEEWSKQPAWQEGLKEALYLAYWYFFKNLNRADLGRRMNEVSDLDEALALARQLKAEHLPHTPFCWPAIRLTGL
jgi:hypothetical protein